MILIPIIDQSNTRSTNVEERKPILNRCAPEIMQCDAVGDRYRIGITLGRILALLINYVSEGSSSHHLNQLFGMLCHNL